MTTAAWAQLGPGASFDTSPLQGRTVFLGGEIDIPDHWACPGVAPTVRARIGFGALTDVPVTRVHAGRYRFSKGFGVSPLSNASSLVTFVPAMECDGEFDATFRYRVLQSTSSNDDSIDFTFDPTLTTRPTVDYSRPPRAQMWADWYDADEQAYDSEYVHPRRYTVNFEVSNHVEPANAQYYWLFTETATGAVERSGWQADAPTTFHAQRRGHYTARLFWRFNRGQYAALGTFPFEVEDKLILSFGDSYASGEGVPDAIEDGWDDAEWVDGKCHRSRTNGAAMAAAQYDADNDQFSVTFLSFACTGAKTDHVSTRGQSGRATASQVDQALAAIWGRDVDHVILSIGGNDMGFSDWVNECADVWGLEDDCTPMTGTESDDGWISGLIDNSDLLRDQGYPRVKTALDRLDPEHVHFVEYPGQHMFSHDPRDGGDAIVELPRGSGDFYRTCGALDNIKDGELKDMLAGAGWLAAEMARVARINGWHLVEGINADFRTHGYCADESYFVDVWDSYDDQDDFKGAVHPNRVGQTVRAGHILRSLTSH